MPKTFKILLVNHGYYLEREFTELAEAIGHARSTTFDCRIDTGTDMVCSVSFFGGVQVISEAYRKEVSSIAAKA
jgi:hypothetical protein